MRIFQKFRSAWKMRNPVAFLLVWGIAELILLLAGVFIDIAKIWWLSGIFWGIWIFLFWLVSDNGAEEEKPLPHRCAVSEIGKKEKLILAGLVLIIILSCVLPMGISPIWNGEIPDHRNQYEVMTESLLEGRLWMDYYVDPKLDEINPYDDAQRREIGAAFQWDHAFYNGKYYMYFGVVPIFLTFMPYRLITGTPLTTYKATQIFTAGIVVGMFWLLYLLMKRFSKKISFTMYAAMATAISLICVWQAVGCPALYCTAITSAICVEVWSLAFFVKAVWDTEGVNKQLIWAFFGAGFGALAFGCRPPVALANILVIPMLCEFLRNHKINWKLVGKMILAASPYVVVAAFLMKYNHARFGNPFEFGQSYQLTVADQTQYSDFWATFDLRRIINATVENFIGYSGVTDRFPYIQASSVYVNFPFLMLSIGILFAPVREKIREYRLGGLVTALFIVPLIITVVDVMWSPFLIEAYRMDIYFVMGVLACLIAGIWYTSLESDRQKRRFAGRIAQLAVFTVFWCVILMIVPVQLNPTDYYPELLAFIEKVVLFGA